MDRKIVSTQYLEYVINKTGMTASAIAKKANLSSTTLTRPLANEDYNFELSTRTLRKIEDATGVSYSGFLAFLDSVPELPGSPTLDEEMPIDPDIILAGVQAMQNNDVHIPVYDVIASAGGGAVNEYEPQTHSLAFPPEYLRRLTSTSPKNLSIISVKGDSMEPTLLDDDIVLLDKSKKNLGFDGMFVLLLNDTLHVKRVSPSATKGKILILSDNKEIYPPIEASLSDVEAVGKVLWYGRKV